MISAITSALGTTKGMAVLLKSTSNIKTTATLDNTIKISMQPLLIDLQSSLIEAQQDYQKLITELEKYKKEINILKKFDKSVNKYETIAIQDSEILIHRYKDEDVLYDLCPVCYINKKKSFLQPRFYMGKRKICPLCSHSVWK